MHAGHHLFAPAKPSGSKTVCDVAASMGHVALECSSSAAPDAGDGYIALVLHPVPPPVW